MILDTRGNTAQTRNLGKYGRGAAVRPQTNDAIWDGVIGLWGRVAPFLSPWCGKKDVPTGVNLNQQASSRSCIPWHSDHESLFGPPNQPKLIVSMSLGNSVEFKVRRRASSDVPSSITLDHGDVLVMDGPAQSEYAHRTASGLQGPRVNLTFRWIAQHIASCPLAGSVGCVLPSCVQGLAKPGPRGEWGGGNKWSSSWSLVLLLLILVFAFWSAPGFASGGGVVTVVSVHPARRCTSPLGVVPVGLGDGVGDCHDAGNLLKERLFYFPIISFLVKNYALFLGVWFCIFGYCWVC